MAAAHESLPHFTATHWMISNSAMDDEGWTPVDNLGTDVTQPPVLDPSPLHSQEHFNSTGIAQSLYYPGKSLPNLLHHCQFFRAGDFGFQKRRIRPVILDCDFPLMMEAPLNLGSITWKERDGEVSSSECHSSITIVSKTSLVYLLFFIVN